MAAAIRSTAMQSKAMQSRGRWIPWLFVAGFLVVIGVNATLIMFATDTFSGLVVQHPYQKGQEFDRTKARLAEQAAMGWQVTLNREEKADGTIVLQLAFRDADGKPLDNLSIAAELQRPVENLAALELGFRPDGAGRYRAKLLPPKHGQWDLHYTASIGERQYEGAERLFVR